jgi:heme-degrading monooxygenase HmoA
MSHARAVAYTITSGTFDETLGLVREGLEPILTGADGFESYSVVDGGDKIVSFTTWATREDAEAAAQTAGAWVKDNLGDRLSVEATVVGEVTKVA